VKSSPLILAVVLLGTICIPLAVLPQGFDAFRLPKAAALRAEAILLVAIFLARRIDGTEGTDRTEGSDKSYSSYWFLLPALALVWMAIATLASTNPAVSVWRLAAGVATLIVFIATVRSAEGARAYLPLVVLPLLAAGINAIVDILQELNIWMPFGTRPDVRHHHLCTAFIGNPNEVGSYLAVAALTCMAAAIADQARRGWFAAGAVLLTAGVIASQTLTAFAALVAGTFALFALLSWKHAFRVAAVAVIVAIVLAVTVQPLRLRAHQLNRNLRAGQYNAFFTDRLTPFTAASLMAADRPLTGVGPGAFAWNYYDYKQRAEALHPELRNAWSRGINFGEVHNDHLQVLAEGGALGYALFLAAIAALGAVSLRRVASDSSPPRRFAFYLALPLAVLWIVISLAQFPLESTAVRMLIVHFAALCAAWRAA
jgi:hypothetical protein